MTDGEPVITITVNEYTKLIFYREKLRKLELAGVDNWEWYDDAMNEENDV